MDITDLTVEEDLALVGLLREIIQADDEYTAEERASIRTLRGQLGADRFDRAIEVAKERFRSRADVKAHAKTIERQEARRLIYTVLEEVAKSDGLDKSEEKPLAWLASWWNL